MHTYTLETFYKLQLFQNALKKSFWPYTNQLGSVPNQLGK